MRICTAELVGEALEYAVAKAEGYDDGWLYRQLRNPNRATRAIPRYTQDWTEVGPILEREKISITYHSNPIYDDEYRWLATADTEIPTRGKYGPTLVIAALRCFVASKLGDELDLPDELF